MNQSDIEFTMGLDTSPAEQKLNSFQQSIRSHIIQEFNSIGSGPSISKTAESAANPKLIEARTKQREITDETKAQSREYNDHYIKLSKFHKLLLSILATWQAIKKVAGAAFSRQSELMQSTGFLSKDPIGTFRANSDREYAMYLAGLSNMGKAAPFSAGALNSFLTKIQTAKEQAMTGKGVNEDLAIAVQQLNRYFGSQLNAEQLLTGDPTRSNVEIARQILDTIEKNMPKLASMPERERSMLMGYLRTFVGEELMDAMAQNLNLNLRTGDSTTMLQKVESHGGNEITNYDVAGATKAITESFEELKEASKKLSDKFLEIISTPLSNFAKTLTSYSNTIEVLLQHNKSLMPRGVQNVMDAYDSITGWFVSKGIPVPWDLIGTLYGSKDERATGFAKSGIAGMIDNIVSPERQDVYSAIEKMGGESAIDTKVRDLRKKPSSFYDVFNAYIMADPAYRSQFGEDYVESFRKEEQLFNIWRLMPNIRKGNYAGVPSELRTIAKYASISASSDKALGDFEYFKKQLESNPGLSGEWASLYGAGGVYDVNASTYQDPARYSTQDLTGQYLNDYLAYTAMKYLQRESGNWIETKVTGNAEVTVQLIDMDSRWRQRIPVSIPLSNDSSMKSEVSAY